MGYPTDLTDEQWALVEPVVRPRASQPGPRCRDLRAVVNALLYMAKSGCQWRLLPQNFPHWSAVRHYFDKWNASGLWQELLEALNRAVREKKGSEQAPGSLLPTRKALSLPRAARAWASTPTKKSRAASASSSSIR
jgi:putative transposase